MVSKVIRGLQFSIRLKCSLHVKWLIWFGKHSSNHIPLFPLGLSSRVSPSDLGTYLHRPCSNLSAVLRSPPAYLSVSRERLFVRWPWRGTRHPLLGSCIFVGRRTPTLDIIQYHPSLSRTAVMSRGSLLWWHPVETTDLFHLLLASQFLLVFIFRSSLRRLTC